MDRRFTVLIADFLDEASVETPVLGDIAQIRLAGARDEKDLSDVQLGDVDALMLYHDIAHLGEATFARAPRLKGLVRAGVGYNNVDLDAAGRRGIVVCNVPDYGTEEVADHTLMFLLALVRRLRSSDATIRAGGWDYRTARDSPRLRGKTLGLIGCGRIGTATALRARAFGLDVVFFDPLVPQGTDKALGVRRVHRLEEVLEQSHFVSLHCYLNPSTHHLINAETLARMRRGSILINTARGPIVDQDALIQALDSGHLSGAGIDVAEREPLDDDRLRFHPHVLLTPHSAFYSVEGFVELRTKTAEEVRRLLLGESPRNPVVGRPNEGHSHAVASPPR